MKFHRKPVPSRKNSRQKKQVRRSRLAPGHSLGHLSILRHELLEDRRMLAAFSESASALNIALNTNEALQITANVNNYTLQLASGTWSGSDDGYVGGNNAATLTISNLGISHFTGGIHISDSGGTGASVSFENSNGNSYANSFDVELHNSPALDGLTFAGASSFGTNNLVANVDTGIAVTAGLSTTFGDITLSANQRATPTSGNFVGINVDGAAITSAAGTITLDGKGGSSGSNNYGVEIQAGGSVQTSGAATLSITGAPGDGTSPAIYFNNGSVSSGDIVTLTGAGGSITEGHANGGADVTGAVVSLVTTGSGNQIGTPPPVGGASTPLKVNASSQLNATTDNGFIALANTTGNMPLGAINAGASHIELTAVGAITDCQNGGGSANLTAADGATLTTTGSNSAIGTSLFPLRTKIGTIAATTNDGGVYLSDSNGPGLAITSILAKEGGYTPVLDGNNHVVIGATVDANNHPVNGHAGTDDVSVTATGPILFASAQGVATTVVAPDAVAIDSTGGSVLQGTTGSNSVLARSVRLIAGGTGSVGAAGGEIGLTVENVSASTTNGSIFLAELISGQVGSVVAGGAGNSVSVTGSGTTLGIGTITASGTVTLNETGGPLVSSAGMNVSGQTVNLTGKSGIGDSGSPFTITAANLSATANTSGAGIFVTDTMALSTMSATTSAGDVTVSYAGGSLNFTASSGLLTSAGGATVSFDNTGGDVALGAVKATSITASGAITAGPGVALSGATVALTAGTGIGATGNPIQANISTLNASTANGDILFQNTGALTVNAKSQGYSDPATPAGSAVSVTSTSGDMTVGTVSALGTVTLSAGGAILAGTGNPFNVIANTLDATAANGIGASGVALSTSVSALTANGGAGGGLFLSNNKTLSVTSASATGGDMNITTLGGLAIGPVSAAGHDLTLSATGALSDLNGSALNLTAQSATLSAASIGSSSDPLETQASTITATATIGGIYISDLGTATVTLTATAAGQGANIDFSSLGDIDLKTITAKGNAVTLNATGTITNGLTAPGVNITAQTLSIVAGNGIATSANPLEILVAQIDKADGGATGVFMDNAGPVAITAGALQASGTGTLSFDAASITILDLGGTVSLAPGRSLLLKTESGPIVFLNQANTIETSGGGTITVEAGTTPGSAGVAVLGNLKTASPTGDGDIKVTADYNITIGLLNAGTADVTVQSANGMLLDGNGPGAVNIIAGTTTLSGTGPTARQLELDEEIKIAAASAAAAEASADQTTADAFNSQLPIINSQVATLQQTLASDQQAATAADNAYNDAAKVLNDLNLAVAVLQTTDLAVDLGVDVALAIAGPAQAVPIFGDGGANTVYAVLKIAEDAVRIAIGAAQVAAAAQAYKVTQLGNADVAADLLAGTDNATLQAELLTQETTMASAAIATAAAANALLASETAAVVSSQAIAARDQANVIGSASDPIGLQVTGAVNVTAGPTDSYLQVTGDTNLDQIIATGSVTLISTGYIHNGAPAGTPNILATGLTIVATGGIGTAANPLITRVGTLNATNTTSGDIDISNTAGTPAALNITGITNSSGGDVTIANQGVAALGEGITVTGPISVTGAGTDILMLNSGSPLTISANITSAGAIVETAAESGTPGDDLTVNPGVTIQSTGSTVTLQAADNVLIPAGSTIEASGSITITAHHNHNPLETAGANVVVEGALVAPSALIDVDPTDTSGNTFTITPSIATPITVTGGAGNDTLNFDANGLSVTILGNTITAQGRQPVTFNSIEAVHLLNPAGGGGVVLDGTPGIANNLVLAGTGAGAGTFTLNAGVPFTFSGVTSFAFNGADLDDQSTITPFATPTQSWNLAITIDGGAGVNTTTFDGVSGISENIVVQPSAPSAGQIIDNNEANGTPIVVVNYIANTNLVVNGSSAAGAAGDVDSLTLKGTDPGSAGASGNDYFEANFAAAGTAANPNVKVSDAVSGNTLYDLQNLTNISTLNVSMGAGDDELNLLNAGSTLNFNIDGGSGSNTLDASGAGTFSVFPGASSDAGSISTPTNNGNSLANVTFGGIQAINLTGTGAHDNLQVFGTTGNDVITQQETGVAVNNGPGISFNLFNSDPAHANAGFTQISLIGTIGDDHYIVDPAGIGPTATLNVVSDAASGGSTLTVAAAGQHDALTVAPVAATVGDVSDNLIDGGTPLGLVTYFGVSNINLIGQTGDGDTANVAGTKGDDSLTYTPGAGGSSGTINGTLDAGNATGFGPFALPTVTFSQMSLTGPVGLFAAPALAMPTIPSPTITGGTDTAVINGTVVSDQFNVAATTGNVSLNNVVISTGGAANLVLNGQGGSDRFNLSGVLPYANTTIDDGSIVNLSGATGPVTVNEGDNTADTNTTITGYGGTVTLLGVDTVNLNAAGQRVAAVGTSQNDNFIYTPTGAGAGSFYDSIGSGNSPVPNTVFNITNATNAFTVFGGSGGDADEVTVQGTGARDLIEINQATAVATVLANNTSALLPVQLGTNVEILNALGEGGQNTFQVVPAAGLGGSPDNLLININGGSGTGANNALVIASSLGNNPAALPATSFVVDNRGQDLNSGTIRVFQSAVANPDINFTNVQVVSPIVATSGTPNGNLMILGPDKNEPNNTQATATNLGAAGNIAVANATVFASSFEFPGVPADQDFYSVTAQQTGTLDLVAAFNLYNPALLPGGGQLNMQVLDAAGNVIASAAGGAAAFGAEGTTANDRIRIPVVAGQTYYVHLFGANANGSPNGAVVNGYNLSIVNTPAIVPFNLELSRSVTAGVAGSPGTGDLPSGAPADDSGRSQLDNVTKDNTPRIYLRLSDGVFLNDLPGNAAPGNPPVGVIPIPFSPNAATPGFRVAIFDGNNAQAPVGFASQVAGFPGLYEYDFTTPLADGIHNLTAEVPMIDPAVAHQTGFGGASATLSITVDTAQPPVAFGSSAMPGSGLAGASDSGVPGQSATIADRITNVSTPTFYGVAEANSIVRLYVQTPGGNVLVGQTTAAPVDGTNALPGGAWTITSTIDLNNPSLGLGLDGVRNMLVTAEDLAGNLAAPQQLSVFVDTQGPQINGIGITGSSGFPLFNTKLTPTTVAAPTPLISSLDITFGDQPVRVGPDFVYPAVNPVLATTASNYSLVGANGGVIPITSVTIADNTASGTPGMSTVTLHFPAKYTPLPDDRYTLSVSNSITDNAGNALQGSFNGVNFPTGLHSGNGSQGQTFVGAFTVDSRAHLANYSSGTVDLDINGNGVFDPNNADANNRDAVITMGYPTDRLFAGNFSTTYSQGSPQTGTASGFDKLATYGPGQNGTFQWTYNLDGIGHTVTAPVIQPIPIDGLPVAGNFDGVAADGDEVGLFDGKAWYFDVLGQGYISAADLVTPPTATHPAGKLPSNMAGLPFVGNFDGYLDLATYQNGVMEFDLASLDPGHVLTGQWNVKLNVEALFPSSIPFNSVTARPVAGYVDGVGQQSSFGLWVPGRTDNTPGTAEWFLLNPLTNSLAAPAPVPAASLFTSGVVTAANPADLAALQQGNLFFNLVHSFQAAPLGGHDTFAEFGNQFSLPLLGIWDPPADGAPSGNSTGDSTGSSTGTEPTSATATWIRDLYTQILHRPASAADVNYWVSQIVQGQTPGRIAQLFVTSNEYRAQQINQLYEEYLGRAAEAAGLAYWTGIWNSTGGPELVQAGIISSPEFFATAQKQYPGLSANAAWVTALYNDLLNRAVDTAGLNYWVNVLQTNSRANVVLGFVTSDEFRFDLINSEFETYLGRAVDQASGQALLHALQSGLTQDQLLTMIVGSNEYMNKP